LRINAVFDPGLKLAHRATSFGETMSNLHFELEAGLMCCGSDPSENIARHQAQGDPVRIVYDDYIVDLKAQRSSGRPARLNRTTNLRWLHAALPRLMPWGPLAGQEVEE
jgi:hypothetical protein